MSKKLLITEEEKNNIKSLYNINEQGAGDALKSLADTIVNMIKTGDTEELGECATFCYECFCFPCGCSYCSCLSCIDRKRSSFSRLRNDSNCEWHKWHNSSSSRRYKYVYYDGT